MIRFPGSKDRQGVRSAEADDEPQHPGQPPRAVTDRATDALGTPLVMTPGEVLGPNGAGHQSASARRVERLVAALEAAGAENLRLRAVVEDQNTELNRRAVLLACALDAAGGDVTVTPERYAVLTTLNTPVEVKRVRGSTVLRFTPVEETAPAEALAEEVAS